MDQVAEIRRSLLAMLIGYLAGVMLLLIVYRSPFYARLPGGMALDGALCFMVPGVVCGWFVYLLPLCVNWDRDGITHADLHGRTAGTTLPNGNLYLASPDAHGGSGFWWDG